MIKGNVADSGVHFTADSSCLDQTLQADRNNPGNRMHCRNLFGMDVFIPLSVRCKT